MTRRWVRTFVETPVEYTVGGQARRRRAAQRSRATAMAETAAAPARSSASRRPPGSSRSSRRRRPGGPSARGWPGSRAVACRVDGTLRRRSRRARRVPARTARSSLGHARARRPREAEVARRACGDQRWPGRSRAGARARHGPGPGTIDRRSDADAPPSPGDRRAERLREPSLARVLQVVQGGADGTGERRAPFELEERCREIRRQPDRRAARKVAGGRRATGRHDAHSGGTLASAPGAGRRQGEIERGGGEPGQRAHGDDDARAALGPGLSAGRRAARRQPDRAAPRTRLRGADSGGSPARPGRRRRSRSARSCRPAAPARRRLRGRAGRGRSTPAVRGCTDTTGRTPPSAGSGLPRKTASIGKRMNIMWMPFAGQPQARPGIEARPAHQAHEPGPQAVGDLEPCGELGGARQVARASGSAVSRVVASSGCGRSVRPGA